ncbi:RNA polymerase subunit sigma-24 [Arthrobacter sp. zg-Y826]|nr:sigma factor-like helix-turn-helix DNA-binding protein [Arthrobacter jinronghuae]MCQ1956589.1 RNA polymerase subunit sigma-24 [Arthrobacter jinronghuae]
MDSAAAVRGRLDALWRIEGARIVAALARVTGDVGLAEDAAQDAVAEALVSWSGTGIPRNPGAWISAVAKRRAIDRWRRAERLQDRYEMLARRAQDEAAPEWDPLPDDVLRLLFTACHPVLSTEAQIALTLRVVGSLSTAEIARLFLVPAATVQQRIVRAKKTLAAARVPFEPPEPSEWTPRLRGVLHVIYLMFTEGYAARELGRPRGSYALQAAIAQCHAAAARAELTDWPRIVLLYETLGRLSPGPVVDLNRAVAVSMATGPEAALAIVDRLAAEGALHGSHLLPSVRAELLARLGRTEEARAEFSVAAGLAGNRRERELLERRAAAP